MLLPSETLSWSFSNLKTNTLNPIYLLSYNFLGYNEKVHRDILEDFIGVDPSRTEWCAYFINALVVTVNPEFSINEPGLARSWLNYGIATDSPQEGDLVIFSRGTEGWKGHVGFFIKSEIIDGKQFILTYGGNQNNSVTYAYYPQSKVLGYRKLPFIKLD